MSEGKVLLRALGEGLTVVSVLVSLLHGKVNEKEGFV
jgi:hypothetical protein